jgi:isopenicillin N synthase-like dioxygenase
LRAGAHSDYGSLTIVRQEDRPGGLEVRDKDGQWLPIKAIPGTFVVNIGDLMMQWTNDTWVSTMHRVANPPPEKAGDSDRISLVFFHQPNYDAMVECLPSCLAPGEKPRYAPVSSGDHLRSKFVRQTTLGKEAEDLAA